MVPWSTIVQRELYSKLLDRKKSIQVITGWLTTGIIDQNMPTEYNTGERQIKERTVVADTELVLTQAVLHEAGLHGRLRFMIDQGEMRILPETT